MEALAPDKWCPEDYNNETIEKETEIRDNLLARMGNLTIEEYRYLQYLLIKYESTYGKGNYKKLSYPLCKITVTGDKLMFIADSHRGNPNIEDKRLIDFAYNEAIKQKIRAVIHAGDFIEGSCYYRNKSYEEMLIDLEKAMKDLPNEIVTGLVLGNHDYSAIRTYKKIIPHYFNFPKLEVLGMKKVLLNWDGIAIGISHPISQLEDNLTSPELINIEGHHHIYRYLEEFRTINLPSLSKETLHKFDDSLYEKGCRAYPLFVIAERSGKSFLFHNYCIDTSLKGSIYVSDTIELDTSTDNNTIKIKSL